MDATATKPSVIPMCLFDKTAKVTLKGVKIRDFADYSAALSVSGIAITAGDDLDFVFVTVDRFSSAGIDINDGEEIRIANCYLRRSAWGLRAIQCKVILYGDNVLEDNARGGILATLSASVYVFPFLEGRDFYATTKIRTTAPVKGYTAAKVVLRSALLLEPPYYGTPETDALEDWVGFLKIMNESGYDAGDYMGVVLETQSMLVGASRVYFSDPGVQDGAATVPAARQIVVASTEGAVSVA